MQLEDFLNINEQRQVVEAITLAETKTSGEIRVHVTPKCGTNVMKEAIKTFNKLEMYKTLNRNAVLIYVAFESRRFAILGDAGINDVVPHGFWNDEKDTLLYHLKQGDPATGLCRVIESVGEKLKAFFPVDDDDVNELSNEISFEK